MRIKAPGNSVGRIARGHVLQTMVACLVVFLALGQLVTSALAANAPVYPDLVPLKSANFRLEKTSSGHYLLRFDSTTANFGGPLEIAVPSLTNKQIYQNIYDATKNGKIVIHTKIGADLIFHPTHNHFHFQDFGSYTLVKRDTNGIYRDTSKVGQKTSFCILDLIRVAGTGNPWRNYSECGATKQGLSSGWADIYDASLADQWIDLGSTMLSDGMYGIRTTADPDNKLFESNDANNTVYTYFSIQNGRLVTGGVQPALCTAVTGAQSAAGPPATVGQNVTVQCSNLKPNETVSLYWGSANTAVRGTGVASAEGTLSTHFVIPTAALGVHYILVRGSSTGNQTAAIVNVVPSMAITPSTVKVDRSTTLSLYGFSPGELVEIGYYKTSTLRAVLGNATMSDNGTGVASVAIPASVYGKHTIDALGLSSQQRAQTYLRISPTLSFTKSSVQPGDDNGVVLRGFAAGETVTLQLQAPARTIGQIVVSSSGSSRSSTDRIIVTSTLDVGTYGVTATGGTSLAVASGSLVVVANSAGDEPSATPTQTDAGTATATETPADTTPVATETATMVGTASATATEVVTDVPTETATWAPSETATDTATASPTVTETSTVPATDIPSETPSPTETANAPP